MSNFSERMVDEFLKSEIFAVVGVSTDKNKFGYRVFQELKKAGYAVYAVNPKYERIYEEKCYPDLFALPEKPDVVEFVCPPKATEIFVEQMKALVIKKAWMQPGAESEKAIDFCTENEIAVLHSVCVMVEMRKKGRNKG